MARSHAAATCVQSDSIKGLAQSIAKPAYRRLLTAEPALRRAVPALIIAFLLTICAGAIVQLLDHRRIALTESARDIEATADILSDRLGAKDNDDDLQGRRHVHRSERRRCTKEEDERSAAEILGQQRRLDVG